MIIANPIYDVVFKRLMENKQVAKFFIGTLLEQTVERLEVCQQEFIYDNVEKPLLLPLSLLRLDFIATVCTQEGELKKVLIEIQKVETNPKVKKLDFSKITQYINNGNDIRCTRSQDHKIHTILDREIIRKTQPAIEKSLPVELDLAIGNTDRAVGAMLSGEVAKRYGNAGLQDNTITV